MRNKEQNARKKARWRANRRYKKLIELTERKMTETTVAFASLLVSQTERALALEIQADEDARIFADILAAQGR